MKLHSPAGVLLATSCLMLSGCGTYYAVRDPGSGNTYYTRDLDRPGSTGTVRFKDGRTDNEITLQNSVVTEISRDEYRRHVNNR